MSGSCRAACVLALLAQSVSAQITTLGGFTPGTREILALSFANAQPGVIPGGLRLVNGNLEVVDQNGLRVLRATTPAEFLVTLPEVLPQDFTIEFDLIPRECGCGEDELAFDGTSGTPSGSFARVQWSLATQAVSGGGPPFTATTPVGLRETLAGQLTTIIASFEGNTLKLYTNGQRLYTLADRLFARGRVLRVILGGQNDGDQAVYMARLRVAAGAGSVILATSALAALPAVQTGSITPIAPPPPPPPPSTPATVALPAAPPTGSITPMAPPPPPTLGQLPPGSTASPTTARNSAAAAAAAMNTGPAPTGLTFTSNHPIAVRLGWNAVSGAVGYKVLRALAGSGAFEDLTPTAWNATWFDLALPQPSRTYSFEVHALQADGRFGVASADFTPPPPIDPTFVAAVRGVGTVELKWVPNALHFNGVAEDFLLSGPGIPQGTRGGWYPFNRTVSGLPPGTHEYSIATIYRLGGVLTPASSWPKATVRLGPTPSTPFLSLPNGQGTPADYNRHVCNAGKWVAGQLLWPNNWCEIPADAIYAAPSAFPLLALFGIEEGINWRGFRIRPATLQTSFNWQWFRNGVAIPVAIFTDELDMGRSRNVGCVTRGSGAAATTMCWGHSYETATLSLIVQTWEESFFLTFRHDGSLDPDDEVRQFNLTFIGLPGAPSVNLDSQGAKHTPHACLSCHGGRYDPLTGKVTGASLLPLDPRGFSFPPVRADLQLVENSRSAQEEVIRQMNQTVFNTNAAVGVREYITNMYGGRHTVIGTTVDDNFIPSGWAAKPDVYRNIYRPYCALCHSTQTGALDFRGWDDLLREKVRVKRAICEGNMPHGETSLMRFWNDGAPAISRPAQLLAALGYSEC